MSNEEPAEEVPWTDEQIDHILENSDHDTRAELLRGVVLLDMIDQLEDLRNKKVQALDERDVVLTKAAKLSKTNLHMSVTAAIVSITGLTLTLAGLAILGVPMALGATVVSLSLDARYRRQRKRLVEEAQQMAEDYKPLDNEYDVLETMLLALAPNC